MGKNKRLLIDTSADARASIDREMTFLSGVPTVLKILVPLSAGAVLAGAIALGATRGNQGAPLPLTAATPTATAFLEGSPEPVASLADLVKLGEEATAAARAKASGVYLFSVLYHGGTGEYTFLFIDPDGRTLVPVVGPRNVAGKPRWDAKTESFPGGPLNPAPDRLALAALRMSPADVVRLFAQKPAVGLAPSELIVQVQVDSDTRQAMWSAIPASHKPQPPGPRGGPILCLLNDADGTWIEPC